MSKPADGDLLSPKKKAEAATKLLEERRGKYIIAQALYVARTEMAKAKHPEHSNIEDMEILSTLYGFPDSIFEAIMRPRAIM